MIEALQILTYSIDILVAALIITMWSCTYAIVKALQRH